MRAIHTLLPVATICFLVGCGSTDDTTSEPVVDESLLTFQTGEFEIPPGDSFECFYTDTFTEKELAVTSAKGDQGPGGHHIAALSRSKAPRGHTPRCRTASTASPARSGAMGSVTATASGTSA